MSESAAYGEALLKTQQVYLSGEAAGAGPKAPRLPVTVYAHGWHGVESWGLWASHRDPRLKAPTALPGGAKVWVALRLHAPPGSDEPRCIVEIGGVESPPQRLTHVSRWLVLEGETSQAGPARHHPARDGRLWPPRSARTLRRSGRARLLHGRGGRAGAAGAQAARRARNTSQTGSRPRRPGAAAGPARAPRSRRRRRQYSRRVRSRAPRSHGSRTRGWRRR